MLSIIICSVSPERLHAVQENIKETIGVGVDYEIIAIDNREKNWSIAKVYNHGASQAQYPYLFFVHEDVKFHSQGWAAFIEQKLTEPDCGVIGFAGSKVKLSTYSGWWTHNFAWDCTYYFQRLDNELSLFSVHGAYLQHPYEEVLTVDGFALFVRKEVWAENQFDEQYLTGFHCYDLDFSMQIAQKYKNYICCTHVLLEHFSVGVINEKWFSETIKMHVHKWRNFLPMAVDGIDVDEKGIRGNEEFAAYNFLFTLLRSNSPSVDKRNVLLEFWARPFSWKHFGHSLACTIKYLRTI